MKLSEDRTRLERVDDTDIIDGSFRIPDGVTIIDGHAFRYTTKLTKIIIPTGVTHILYDAFEGCESLTHVTIPDGVIEIGNGVFGYCTGLIQVTIPDSAIFIGHAFHNCPALTDIIIQWAGKPVKTDLNGLERYTYALNNYHIFFQTKEIKESINIEALLKHDGDPLGLLMDGLKQAIDGGSIDPRLQLHNESKLVHYAAQMGDLEFLIYLIRSGADCEARRPYDDKTPLMVAACSNQRNIVEFLLQAGVDTTLTAIDHDILRREGDAPPKWTALEMAEARGFREIAAAIRGNQGEIEPEAEAGAPARPGAG